MGNKKNITMLGWFKENYPWIVALFAIGGTIIGFLIRMNDYLNFSFLSSYYGLNIEHYSANETSLLFTICIGALVLALISSLLYCNFNLYNCIFKKGQGIVSDISIIGLVTFVLSFILNGYKISIRLPLLILGIIIIQIVLVIVIYFGIKTEQKKEKKLETMDSKNYIQNAKNYFKKLPWYTLGILLIIAVCNYISFALEREYYIINSNNSCQAIIYTTNEYYLTLDCKIKKATNKLILYKGAYNKIESNNIRTKLVTFDKMEIK